ncbi:hypothetical protein CPB86DRAFT_524131 [Serendipita vermifera]|nr:hypothetical protein CPB86DRAFT_524131 [Serendipita vermifera]
MAQPLFRRPLDILYLVFFLMHLCWALPFGGQALYPKWVTPQVAQDFVQNYIKDTNDPWMLAIWNRVPYPFEWVWTKVYLWFEMTVQVPIALASVYALVQDLPTYYPMILAYCGGTIIMTATTTVMTLAAPSTSTKNLDAHLAFFALTDESKKTVAIANFVFFVIPVIMVVDIGLRTISMIRKAIRADAVKKSK